MIVIILIILDEVSRIGQKIFAFDSAISYEIIYNICEKFLAFIESISIWDSNL